MKNEKQKEKKVSSADAVERKHQKTQVELSLRAILETAKAVQHIRTLEQLNEILTNMGEGRVTIRRTVIGFAELCCDPRRIVALMLYAAEHPDWAWVNFWAAFCPEMSIREMAKMRKINPKTAAAYLKQTELPSDAYEFIPENH